MVAPPGEFGKPRPALIIQSNLSLTDATVTFLPFTTDLGRFPLVRIPIVPSEGNGLKVPSEAMVNLVQTVGAGRISRVIGRLDGETMQSVETALMVHLGLV